MLADTAEEVEELDEQDELPPGTPRALSRLGRGQISRKNAKLTRRAKLARSHAPKVRPVPRHPDGLEAWQELRAHAYVRAGYRCEKCGKFRDQAFGGVLDGHHRILRSRGGKDELCNIAVLCRECHEWCHRNPKAATGLGFIVPSRADASRRGMQVYDGSWVLLDNNGNYAWRGTTKPEERAA